MHDSSKPLIGCHSDQDDHEHDNSRHFRVRSVNSQQGTNASHLPINSARDTITLLRLTSHPASRMLVQRSDFTGRKNDNTPPFFQNVLDVLTHTKILGMFATSSRPGSLLRFELPAFYKIACRTSTIQVRVTCWNTYMSDIACDTVISESPEYKILFCASKKNDAKTYEQTNMHMYQNSHNPDPLIAPQT